MNRSAPAKILVTIAVSLLCSGQLSAERAPRKVSELSSSSSNVVSGVLLDRFERKQKKGNFEYTYYVAEVVVNKVEKGSDIEVGDRIYVKYWRKRWTGLLSPPPPDTYGHYPIPEQGDRSDIYIKGSRKTGFEVLHPNGFFRINKPTETLQAKDPSGSREE